MISTSEISTDHTRFWQRTYALMMGSNSIPIAVSMFALIAIFVAYKTLPYFNRGRDRNHPPAPPVTANINARDSQKAPCCEQDTASTHNQKASKSNVQIKPNAMLRVRSAPSFSSQTGKSPDEVAPPNPLRFGASPNSAIHCAMNDRARRPTVEGSSTEPAPVDAVPFPFGVGGSDPVYRSNTGFTAAAATDSSVRFGAGNPLQFGAADCDHKSNGNQPVTISKYKETTWSIAVADEKPVVITKTTTEHIKIPREVMWSQFTDGLKYAVAEEQGLRKHMENSTGIFDFQVGPSPPSGRPSESPATAARAGSCSGAGGKKLGFSVFDGHMGSEAAKFCTAHLHEQVDRFLRDSEDDSDCAVEEALRKAFHATESEWERYALANHCEAGAVGVFVFYRCGFQSDPDCLYVANVGDCRAILCSKGDDGASATVLTEDHNAHNDRERQRCGERLIPKHSELLSGHIAVTRAIGDYVDCTAESSASREGQYRHKKVEGLICDPHIARHELSQHDEFLIIACDGLWEVMSNEVAMRECRRSLRKDGDVKKAADKLVALAKKMSSRSSGGGDAEEATSDNISVMVLGFAKQDQSIVEPLPAPPRGRRRSFLRRNRLQRNTSERK